MAEPKSPAVYRRTAERTKRIAARTDDATLRRLRLQIAMTLLTLATEVEKLEAIKLSMPLRRRANPRSPPCRRRP